MPQLAGDAPLLATKLFVPPPRENLVARPRLRDQLSSVRGGQVILIAAAAGWGKSTLLADWALEASARIAWLSLDESDDDPRRFLSYIIAALRNAEGIGRDDLGAPLPASLEALHAAVTDLLNTVAQRGNAVALVLDDYHLIRSTVVHELVQFIVDHNPQNLIVGIATRADPPLSLSRLRARGMLTEIRGDDLRFTEDEATAFLNGSMGLALTGSDVAELERRTEGWPVGLQMAAISLKVDSNSDAFIRRFSGSNRYVLDYLTDEVLNHLTADARKFLIETSILTRLNHSLCDAVTMRSDTRAILQELDAANLFLIPLDDVREWYRYHHLFATVLQHQLALTHTAEQIADLHRRACDWYTAHRMPDTALEHALAAKDVDRALRIVGAHSLERTIRGDMASVVRWFDLLPADRVESNINLLLSRAMALLGDWQLPRALDTAIRAYSLLTDDSPDAIRGAVLAVRGTLERVNGNPVEGNANLRRALPLVDREQFWGAFAEYQVGLEAIIRADAKGLVEELAGPRERHDRRDQVLIAVLAQTYTAMAEWWRGHADRALELANEMFAWTKATAELTPERPLEGLPNAILAEVHCSRNDLENARTFADRGVEHARHSFNLAFFEAARALADVAMAQRDWESATRAAADAQRAVRNVGSQFYWIESAVAVVHRVRFQRWRFEGNHSDLVAVEQYLQSSRVLERFDTWEKRRYCGLSCDAPFFLAIRVFIEQGRYDDAVALIDEILPHAAETERLLAQIEALILRSTVLMRRGSADAAVDTMVAAMQIAARPRYVRQFLDEGPELTPIIERAAARIGDFSFLTKTPIKIAVAAHRDDNLSEREVEVLRLVATGASNQAAARKLFIAPSTVKKHLENIYSKLDVGGRTEAIARARELKLLL